MKTVAEALALVLKRAPLLETERVDLANGLGRVLREDARTDLDHPSFDSANMDGYALNADDPHEWLAVVCEIQSGDTQEYSLRPGECTRIFTGARIPRGANRVLMQEEAELSEGRLRKPSGGAPEHIRKRGENCARGDLLIPKGQPLRAVDLAILASCGIPSPLVSRKPQVVHFVTGNELIAPSQIPMDAQIRDCNSTLIAALLEECGAALAHQSHLPDDLSTGIESIQACPDFDLLLISGGASVGDYDFARPLLENAGFAVVFHGVNMRPGKPLLFATRGRQLAFALPGNPVSHAVVFRLFLTPLLAAMRGATPNFPFLNGYLIGEYLPRPEAREAFWPCHAQWDSNAFRLCPVPTRSSGDIIALQNANALLRIPAGKNLDPTKPVEFIWLA